MITTPVRKNNTIRYRASRYTVPIGTYTRYQTASIREVDDHLEIYDHTRQFLDSANDMRDFADYAFRQATIDEILDTPSLRVLPDAPRPIIPDIKVIQRQLASYMELVRKGGK